MTTERSNTAGNSRGATGRPFEPGDPRINRKGRPKSFDKLRELAQQIGHETAKGRAGQEVVIDGHIVTVTEAILRQWAVSKNPKLQIAFMEIAFGKVPQATQLTGGDGGPLAVSIIEVVKSDASTD